MTDKNYEPLKKDITERLESLNYKVDNEKDEFILKFLTDKVEQEIINRTNQSEVSDELRFVLIERVCGEFLYSLRGSNMLTNNQIDAIISSVKEGDTSVSFDVSSSPEAKFDILVSYLRNYGYSEILRYRRIVW